MTMESDSPRTESTPAAPPAPPWRASDVVRLVVAVLLTMSVVPYCAGRAIAIWQVAGRPERRVLAVMLVAVLVLMACNWRLSERFKRPWLDRVVFWWVLGGWIVATIVAAVINFNGDFWHRALVWLVLFPATLWGLWSMWMFYKPVSWRTRLGVLTVLLAPQAVALALLRIDGMDGWSHLNFAWRWQPLPQRYTELGKVVPSSPRLAPITGSGEPGEGTSDALPASDVVAAYQPVTASDFAEYLGPHRNGVIDSVRLDPDWTSRAPQEIWRRKVGLGWSGFAIVGDDAFTQEQRETVVDDKPKSFECVVCYDARSGEEKWVHTDQTVFDSSMGGVGPRGTPTVSDGRVFAIGATGRLNALEAATGRVLWTRDVLADFDAGNIDHGVCGSPLVVDGFVVVAPTGSGGPALVAYSCVDGKLGWSGVKRRASYGSPMLVELAGRRQILVYHSAGVSGADPQTGEELWELDWTGTSGVNCSQPIVNAGAPDQVFIGTGYSKGSTLVKLVPQADGRFDPQQLWTSKEMQLKFTTAVLVGEHIYGLDDGIFECIALKTGKRAWQKGRYGHGQLLLVGGLILIQAESGEVVLVQPNPKKLEELGRFPGLDGRTWNVPAIARGRLYIRNDRDAACYSLPLLEQAVARRLGALRDEAAKVVAP